LQLLFVMFRDLFYLRQAMNVFYIISFTNLKDVKKQVAYEI